MSNNENRKQTVSQVIITVAVAVLVALGALLVFALDRSRPTVYWVLFGAAASSLAASIYFGALGIARLPQTLGFFDRQAKFCLLGFVLAIASCFFLGPKTPTDERLHQSILQITDRLGTLEAKLTTLATQDSVLYLKVDSLRRQLDTLKAQQGRPRRKR